MFNSDWWFGDNSLWGQATDKVEEAFTGGTDWWFGDNSIWGQTQDMYSTIFGLGNLLDSQASDQIQEQGYGGMSNIDALMEMFDAREEEEGYMTPQKQENNIFR